jgi:hypothetical protein
MLTTGRWRFLEHLKGSTDPVRPFRSIPGMDRKLAHRVCDALHIETLEALEMAVHDGRLEHVPGFGPRRALMMLGRVRSRAPARDQDPAEDVLLDVDKECRRWPAPGDLIKIALKRFNPHAKPWLPVLHTTHEGWHFIAIYSNTVRSSAWPYR